jgi:hypothetical protein
LYGKYGISTENIAAQEKTIEDAWWGVKNEKLMKISVLLPFYVFFSTLTWWGSLVRVQSRLPNIASKTRACKQNSPLKSGLFCFAPLLDRRSMDRAMH